MLHIPTHLFSRSWIRPWFRTAPSGCLMETTVGKPNASGLILLSAVWVSLDSRKSRFRISMVSCHNCRTRGFWQVLRRSRHCVANERYSPARRTKLLGSNLARRMSTWCRGCHCSHHWSGTRARELRPHRTIVVEVPYSRLRWSGDILCSNHTLPLTATSRKNISASVSGRAICRKSTARLGVGQSHSTTAQTRAKGSRQRGSKPRLPQICSNRESAWGSCVLNALRPPILLRFPFVVPFKLHVILTTVPRESALPQYHAWTRQRPQSSRISLRSADSSP